MKRKYRAVVPVATVVKPMSVSYEAIARFNKIEPIYYKVQAPKLAPGVVPASAKNDTAYMAMDAANSYIYDYVNDGYSGMGFPGYPHLATLTQKSEFRSPSETTASEMTRKWIRISSKGDGAHADKITIIEDELKRHKVRDMFRVVAEQDGFFGRAQIYVDVKGIDDESRKLPLVIDKATIKKGALNGFKVIEAIWTTPYAYNSDNPMAPDFYKPTSWFILGKQTHATRLLTFISREVPDLIKPAYNFGGISMSQLMEPYVIAWLRTRDAVSDLIHSFSLTGIKTNMGTALSGGTGDDLVSRIALFNQIRDNRGTFVLDKDTEEFFQFNVPLSSLDKLQAQSQEHMAAPSHMPLIKLLGITPSGLNASSEGELQVWYDYVASMQENLFRQPLKKIIDIIQLDKFGMIEEAITFEFEPLEQMNGTELSQIRKSDSDSAVALINAGVISPLEERDRLASDVNSGYNSLVAEDLPEVPEDPDAKPNEDLNGD